MQGLLAAFMNPPADDEGGFNSWYDEEHVPLRLATFGDESLISRSSGRRVLSRAEKFDEVTLDFSGIRTVGQAFADEIFRVFQRNHPEVILRPINANTQITSMISRARSRGE